MNPSPAEFEDFENATDSASLPIDQVGDECEYEEICSDEVDRIVQSLEELMAGVESENIRAYLEEAADNIFALVYEDTEGELLESEESSELSDDMAA